VIGHRQLGATRGEELKIEGLVLGTGRRHNEVKNEKGGSPERAQAGGGERKRSKIEDKKNIAATQSSTTKDELAKGGTE